MFQRRADPARLWFVTDRKNEPLSPSSPHLPRPLVHPAAPPVGVRIPGERSPKRRLLRAPHTAPPPVPRVPALRSSPARSGPGGPVARRRPSRMRRVAGGLTTTQRSVSGPPQPGHAKPFTRNTRSNRSCQLGRSPASGIRGCRVSRLARRALAASRVSGGAWGPPRRATLRSRRQLPPHGALCGRLREARGVPTRR